MKKLSPVVLVGLGLTIVSLVLFIVGPGFVQTVSNGAYDSFVRQSAKPAKAGRVAVIDLDDYSLERFGQWPWPRYLVADMTRRIQEAGASVVAFDIVFAEKDRTSPQSIEKSINDYFNLNVVIQGVPDDLRDFDRRFAEVIGGGRVILGCAMHYADAVSTNVDTSADRYYQSRVLPRGRGELAPLLTQADGMTIAITNLCANASIAFFNAVPDADNIIRSNPLVWGFGPERIYPSLALEAIRLDQGAPQIMVAFDEQGIKQLKIKDLEIPVDNLGRLVINYRQLQLNPRTGADISFPTYSAADIISGKVGRAELADKIVFIGTSAVGLKDVKATPLTQYFAGVEVHATIVDNILSGDVLRRPYEMTLVQFLLILFMGIFLSVFISRGRSWLSFLVSVGMIAAVIAVSKYLIEVHYLVMVPVWAVLSVMIIYPVLTTMKYWQEELQKKRVRNMFGTMVSNDVLRYLENNPGSFSLSGQRREATMFFSDVAGFTTISESLQPEKLSELLNRYLSPMTDIIMGRGGYVDKYEGDAIMAEWGVPYQVDDHATQACYAALEQQEKLAEIRAALKDEFGHELNVRMGMNSGSVTAGNMGSARRFQYTVMGDAVNQAARFEPANKDYDTLIMMGETTYELAKGHVEARLLDRIIVKGKTVPIRIYELLAKKGELSEMRRKVVALYEEALALHCERKWDEAMARLDAALALDPSDGPSGKMRTRVMAYKVHPPPPTWQGEYVKTSKD